ncbi:hypothetical protein B5M44_21950 [Shinella sumterensis]|uniref:hypothetical protein n=1 Tax=Shinella sumterensis TaxID=1967501 RepID=UPI00106EE79F|nr:hypothetical protein [Shinella sumterensis]MCD1266916.1 hypothetical protein [Shinella sumterensis]TFE95202.1 hypothetical protein B5M44_21950 [Shinella sumterensis]
MDTLDRCDLRTLRECDCEPSGKPCHFQPGAFEIIRDANNDIARHGPTALILAAAIVFAISLYAATKFGTTGI